jgi:hypothetical protein
MNPLQTQFIDLSSRSANFAIQMQDPRLIELAENAPAASQDRYQKSARALRLHSLPRPVAIDAESARWLAFLKRLSARAAAGEVSGEQRATLLAIWDRALSRQPAMRRPAVGVSAEGVLLASWAFADIPGRTFTLEILRDGSLAWFFRDRTTGNVHGTSDEPERYLPDDALELLASNFAASSGTR